MTTVNASGQLPPGWWNRPDLADEINARIRAYLLEGYGYADIARHVGCSNRTVNRLAAKMTP